MEALFKQKLIDLSSKLGPQTFGQALFPHRYFDLPTTKSSEIKKKIAFEEEGFSEQKHIIESLERFVEERQVVSVGENAEIGIKKASDWEIHTQTYLLDKEYCELMLKEKSQVEVIFVTETLRPFKEFESELKEAFIDQLLAGFPQKTAELFERMILAMKLNPEQVILWPSEIEGKDLFNDIVLLTEKYRPQVIITLGAKATSSILKSKDRLAQVHGQFFERKTAHQLVQVVPLFHPNIIETNQNMKKTAWIDMQKVMKYLKILP